MLYKSLHYFGKDLKMFWWSQFDFDFVNFSLIYSKSQPWNLGQS